MKKTNKNYLIVALIVILLALSLGYAAFASQLNITGTVEASADWNIHFSNPVMTGANNENTVALSNSDKTLTVAVKLTEPGDSHKVTVDIVNEGEFDAQLSNFVVSVKDGESVEVNPTSGTVYTVGAIKMTIQSLTPGTSEKLVAETGSRSYELNFEWPMDYVSDEVNDTASFEITFDYDQV